MRRKIPSFVRLITTLIGLIFALSSMIILLCFAREFHKVHYIAREKVPPKTICPFTFSVDTKCLKENASKEGYCVPHEKLFKVLGRPEPCQHTLLVLECSDPCISYLEDIDVLTTCGISPSEHNFSNENAIKTQTKENTRETKDDYHYNSSTSKICTSKELLISKKIIKRENESRVPNIVHYVQLGCNRIFSFIAYLSVLSVDRFIEPSKIYFHGDCLPSGKWWNRTMAEIPNIYWRHRERPRIIQGRKPMWIQHETDIIRLEVLLAEGGIYIDTDVLVVKPIANLMNYPITMGYEYVEQDTYLGSGFVLAEPDSKFLCLWLHAFREYNPESINDWAKYAVVAPGRVSQKYPDLIHIEERSFHRPNWNELHLLYDGFYDWSSNYIIHLWNRNAKHKIPKHPRDLPRSQNVASTAQEVMRFIYYNEKKKIRGAIKFEFKLRSRG